MAANMTKSAGRKAKVHQRPEMVCPLPRFDVINTPSRARGISPALEQRLRIVGCEIIQNSGILLKCSQVLAMACLFLACKVEEESRRLRTIMNVGRHVLYTMSRHYESGTLVAPLELGGDAYHELKRSIIKAESLVLKELGFCVHLGHPHKELAQRAWNYMNDALRSYAFIQHETATIACACLDLACVDMQIGLPKQWYEVFDVDPEAIMDTRTTILSMYSLDRVFLNDVIHEIQSIAIAQGSNSYCRLRALMVRGIGQSSTQATPRVSSPSEKQKNEEALSDNETASSTSSPNPDPPDMKQGRSQKTRWDSATQHKESSSLRHVQYPTDFCGQSSAGNDTHYQHIHAQVHEHARNHSQQYENSHRRGRHNRLQGSMTRRSSYSGGRGFRGDDRRGGGSNGSRGSGGSQHHSHTSRNGYRTTASTSAHRQPLPTTERAGAVLSQPDNHYHQHNQHSQHHRR